MKRLISPILQSGSAIKNFCFAKGLIKPLDVGLPVISVGNLAVGGRGKTSIVQWLVKELKDVAVLTRGYRSKLEHSSPRLIDAGYDPKICGDEPALIARMEQKPLVFVGKNRCQSAMLAKKAGAKAIILDDGMQYRYLKRNIEIVCVSQEDFNGKSFLREKLRELKRADLVVLMGACDRKGSDVLLKSIARYTGAPVCGACYRIDNVRGKKIAAFCALGHSQRFFNDLERAGGKIVASLSKADHRAFSKSELEKLASDAKEAQVLMCTAKDWVKLPNMDLPIECAHAELEWTFGKEHIERIVYEIMD